MRSARSCVTWSGRRALIFVTQRREWRLADSTCLGLPLNRTRMGIQFPWLPIHSPLQCTSSFRNEDPCFPNKMRICNIRKKRNWQQGTVLWPPVVLAFCITKALENMVSKFHLFFCHCMQIPQFAH